MPRRAIGYRVTRVLPLALVACMCWLCINPRPALARDAGHAILFDIPLAQQVLPAAGNRSEVTCIRFADLMVRELATDGPGGGPSTLVPISAGAPQPACTAGNYPASLPVQGATALLAGRKGQYLIFRRYAAAGAQPFEILDARTAHILYTDGLSPTTDALQSLSIEGPLLHLRFVREINAPCSLLQQPSACWAKLLQAKSIPQALASAPPTSICTQSYRQSHAPAGDTSQVLYDVDMTLTPAGKANVISRGKPSCEPAS